MRSNPRIGAAALLGILGVAALGGCDLIVNIGTYCVEGKDPGCGGAGTGGAGATGGSGGGGTSATGGQTGGSTTSSGGTGGAPECVSGATQDCYYGPDGTMGVGACHAGLQTCEPDGVWGTCDGEVIPGVETCASTKDEDCNETECALWSQVYGDLGFQHVLDIAIDPSGNLLVLGFFTGDLTGIQPPLSSAGSYDLFLLKLSPDGGLLWAKRWGDSNDQSGGAMAIDSAGNILLAGGFNGTLDFGNSYSVSSVGSADIYVVKLNPDGDPMWIHRFGDNKGQSAYDVAVNKLGDLFLVGTFSGTMNLGDGNVTSAGLGDAYIAKYAATGAFLWKRILGDGTNQRATNVAVDSSGDAIFSGAYDGSFVFGGMTLSNSGQTFLAKISAGGTDIWAKSYPVADAILAVDQNDTYWATGYVTPLVNFGGVDLPPGGGYDVYLAQFDKSGAYLNAKRFGGGGNDQSTSLAIDSSGHPIITGQTDGGVDFGNGPLSSAGQADIIVARFDSQLNAIWSRRFGDDQAQGFGIVATDTKDFIYLGAKTSGTVNFGAGDLVSKGDDVVVAKLAP